MRLQTESGEKFFNFPSNVSPKSETGPVRVLAEVMTWSIIKE